MIDSNAKLRSIQMPFCRNLREEQEEAASVLPCYDTGVLCARYGFWQVTAAAVIARRTYTGILD